MKRKYAWITFIQVVTLGVLLNTQNCSDVQFEELVQDSIVDPFNVCEKDPSLCEGPLPPEGTPLNKNFQYTHPNAPQTLKLDVLFVTDTSQSFDAEREAVALGIKNFINNKFSDIRIGVTLAHVKSAHSGTLFRESDSKPYVLSSEDYDLSNPSKLDKLKYDLLNRLVNVKGENISDGGEAMLYSYMKAITVNKQKIQSQGFFRNDAALAVIFVSDENDICSRDLYPSGSIPVYDPEKVETPAYNNYCLNSAGVNLMRPSLIIDRTQNLKGNLPFVISGVIYTNPPEKKGENEIGHGMLETIAVANGIPMNESLSNPAIDNVSVDMNLSPSAISSGLGLIGNIVKQKINLKDSFVVELASNQLLVESSVQVRVDGRAVNHTLQYDRVLNRATVHVAAASAGQYGSKVEIHYTVMDYK